MGGKANAGMRRADERRFRKCRCEWGGRRVEGFGFRVWGPVEDRREGFG